MRETAGRGHVGRLYNSWGDCRRNYRQGWYVFVSVAGSRLWRGSCSVLFRGLIFGPRTVSAEIAIVTYQGTELRVDWVMRQYVETIIQYLSRGGSVAGARRNMTERGVPVHVQDRVFEGQAALQ